MSSKKDDKSWPKDYEPPKLYHIETTYQQAMGATQCSNGSFASGGGGSCNNGDQASGSPDEPNACSNGEMAHVGPGHGHSSCGHGYAAHA